MARTMIRSLAIGQRVRAAREGRQLSRELLARDADVSTSMVVRLELEGKVPNGIAMTRIVNALDLSLDDVMQDEALAS